MIWGPGGSKSRLAKAAGAEPAGQMRHEKVHTTVARSTLLEVEMWKKTDRQTDRQIDRQTEKYVDKQIERQLHR